MEIASTGEILDPLLAGRLQLALVGDAQVDDRITLEPFLGDEIVGVARPDVLDARDGEVDPAQLAEQTLLLREPASSTRRLTDRALAEAGVRPRQAWELDSSEAIKRAAREGLGVAFLSRYAVAEEVERGDLESFRLAGRPRIERKLNVARPSRRAMTPSEQRFVATLTRCCAKSADYASACVG